MLARQTKNARILVLGYPIGHRPDPLRGAEELSTIDVVSRGRLDMGFIKGVPYEFPASNQNPVGVMDRFWEAHDFIIKAMTSHDEPFNWEGEYFHYRQVNIWPRPVQQPHPPVWTTTGSKTHARVLGEKGYVIATLGSGYATRPLYDAYREGYRQVEEARAGRPLRLSGLVATAHNEAEARRRGELVAGYLRTRRSCMCRSAIRRASSRSTTTPACCAARARRAASPRTAASSTCTRQRAGPDRRRHHVLRHARPGATSRSSTSPSIAAAWATS